jgi:hypothetical protein
MDHNNWNANNLMLILGLSTIPIALVGILMMGCAIRMAFAVTK